VGVKLLPSPAVADSDIFAIPEDFSYVVQREDVTLDIDASPFFTSDRIAVRAAMRIGFGIGVHPGSIVHITLEDGS
jgi:hypothetical protein